jgi:hypothetical protein
VSLRWSTVTPQQRRIAVAAAPYVARWGGYLAGGTAVALRLGHRRSVDLDYFTRKKIDADSLAADARKIARNLRLDCELEEGNRRGRSGPGSDHSLTDFTLAETTMMPTMLKTAGRSWPAIKRYLVKWASASTA